MSGDAGPSESLPSRASLGENGCRMSNETTPPLPGGNPDRRRLRSRRRGDRPRDRDWMGAAKAAPPAMTPGMMRLLVFGIIGIGAIVAFGTLRKIPSADSERLFRSLPVPTIGTPAADAGWQAAVDEQRQLADSLFGPELRLAADSTDFAEEPGWRKAVEVMASLDPQFVVDHLDFSLNLHYDKVMANPSAYRGRFVRMRGIVGESFSAKKLDQPIAGRTDVYRGQISDPDGDSDRAFFDVLDPPPPFRKKFDAVDVDGVFYRTLRYETVNGKMVEVPWIIARTVVLRNSELKSTSTSTLVGAFVAFLALVGSIVYLVRGSRPRKAAPKIGPAGFREMFDERLRAERTKEPPPPPGARD